MELWRPWGLDWWHEAPSWLSWTINFSDLCMNLSWRISNRLWVCNRDLSPPPFPLPQYLTLVVLWTCFVRWSWCRASCILWTQWRRCLWVVCYKLNGGLVVCDLSCDCCHIGKFTYQLSGVNVNLDVKCKFHVGLNRTSGHPGPGLGVVQMSELKTKQGLGMSFLSDVRFVRTRNDPDPDFCHPYIHMCIHRYIYSWQCIHIGVTLKFCTTYFYKFCTNRRITLKHLE